MGTGFVEDDRREPLGVAAVDCEFGGPDEGLLLAAILSLRCARISSNLFLSSSS